MYFFGFEVGIFNEHKAELFIKRQSIGVLRFESDFVTLCGQVGNTLSDKLRCDAFSLMLRRNKNRLNQIGAFFKNVHVAVTEGFQRFDR